MFNSLTQHIIDSLPVHIAYVDAAEKYIFINNSYSDWLKLNKKEVIGKKIDEVLGQERYAAVKIQVDRALSGQNVTYETTMPSGAGNKIFFGRYIPFININGDVEGFSVLGEDITDRKKLEDDKNNLILELQKAIDEIKVLKGVIPICAYCHNIRDEKGAWDRLEAYITKNSKAEFTHGICPTCMKEERAKAGLKQTI